jgi:small-conductance mechanosensitive channel
MSITAIIFTIFMGLAAIILGLLLRRMLVRRLKKTILDNWIIQTLGVLIIFPPLIIAGAAIPFILNNMLLQAFWDQIKTATIRHIPDIINFAWGSVETILVLVLGIGVARTIMNLIIKGLGENRIDINIRTLIGRIFFIIVIIIAIFWILSIWRVAIDLPVAVLGTLTIAFTFAIQDILKDLFAGFYILMERPFHIGDLITIGDQTRSAAHTGVVEDVQIRATKLRIVSGEQITIPNALVFGGIVTNNSFYGERRASITVTLPLESFDKKTIPERILQILQEDETVMAKPEPSIMITSYAGKQVTLAVRFWVANGQVASISEVMYTLRTALPEADITVIESAGNI